MRTRRRLVSQRWSSLNFDRARVLGSEEDDDGHTGCVNALSWARDGELLLSAGDDRTVRVWRMDPTVDEDYPFLCRGILHTGHMANIFNAHMLPHSSNIATVAGDRQVRVHEMGQVRQYGPPADSRTDAKHSCIRRLRCHDGRVKRLVTEDSPHLFLTVSEDGTVRQHDLRTPPHDCSEDACPPPLIKVDFPLSTMAFSSLTSYQFVVAGESEYGYLFDRRHAGRFLKEERGMVENGMTHCVRRFGRRSPNSGGYREHITGARMSSQNGHELLLSYSGDAVYLYSTRDDAEDKSMSSKRPRDDSSSDTEDDTDSMSDHDPWLAQDAYSGVPLIMPRAQFAGARNVATIKDVNFLGPDDEFVTSGSDDGHFFVWRKKDGALQGLFEGDGSVVNVIEGHPHLPLVAASGIDTTVKLFAPVSGPSAFSRMDSADRIISSNANQAKFSRRVRGPDLSALLAAAVSDDSAECTHQ
ncbi:WD40 repeat-like protein [Roridomyces roridus]|uniref:WD40 repeat-like protein n=1 Tax=Roridomyces roridus TaxID=1738132 RepID=A0AAD7C4S9_9AGAR|nr:WD40 repeat-like protein [Roridomyces roridus]